MKFVSENGNILMKDLTKDESKILKGIAILFMIGLHLYNTLDYENLYQPILKWGGGAINLLYIFSI